MSTVIILLEAPFLIVAGMIWAIYDRTRRLWLIVALAVTLSGCIPGLMPFGIEGGKLWVGSCGPRCDSEPMR